MRSIWHILTAVLMAASPLAFAAHGLPTGGWSDRPATADVEPCCALGDFVAMSATQTHAAQGCGLTCCVDDSDALPTSPCPEQRKGCTACECCLGTAVSISAVLSNKCGNAYDRGCPAEGSIVLRVGSVALPFDPLPPKRG